MQKRLSFYFTVCSCSISDTSKYEVLRLVDARLCTNAAQCPLKMLVMLHLVSVSLLWPVSPGCQLTHAASQR